MTDLMNHGHQVFAIAQDLWLTAKLVVDIRAKCAGKHGAALARGIAARWIGVEHDPRRVVLDLALLAIVGADEHVAIPGIALGYPEPVHDFVEFPVGPAGANVGDVTVARAHHCVEAGSLEHLLQTPRRTAIGEGLRKRARRDLVDLDHQVAKEPILPFDRNVFIDFQRRALEHETRAARRFEFESQRSLGSGPEVVLAEANVGRYNRLSSLGGRRQAFFRVQGRREERVDLAAFDEIAADDSDGPSGSLLGQQFQAHVKDVAKPRHRTVPAVLRFHRSPNQRSHTQVLDAGPVTRRLPLGPPRNIVIFLIS